MAKLLGITLAALLLSGCNDAQVLEKGAYEKAEYACSLSGGLDDVDYRSSVQYVSTNEVLSYTLTMLCNDGTVIKKEFIVE